MSAAILLVWMLSGVAAARVSSTDRDWQHWAPVSMFFGPLWLTVAAEQRHHDRTRSTHSI